MMSSCGVSLSLKKATLPIIMWATIIYNFQKTSEKGKKEHVSTLSGLREENHWSSARGDPMVTRCRPKLV